MTGAIPSVLSQMVPVVPLWTTVIFAKYCGKLTGVAVLITSVPDFALLAAICFLSHINYRSCLVNWILSTNSTKRGHLAPTISMCVCIILSGDTCYIFNRLSGQFVISSVSSIVEDCHCLLLSYKLEEFQGPQLDQR